MAEIHQPLDFVGLNICALFNNADWGGDKNAPTTGLPRTSIGWVVDERVMYWAVRFIYEDRSTMYHVRFVHHLR